MADSYDLILKGGTVVNQDGEGLRDIGIRDGHFSAIGDLSRASAGSAFQASVRGPDVAIFAVIRTLCVRKT